MSEQVISAQELDYSTVISSHGSYKYSRVIPSDRSSVDLYTNSSIETLIELPLGSKCVNFEKSMLTFKLSKPGEAGNSSVMHTKGIPCIQRIRLYDKGGANLCELNNFDDYHSAVSPYLTKQSDFKTNPESRGVLTEREKGFGVFPSRTVVAATAVSTSAVAPRNGLRLVHGAGDSTIAAELPSVGYEEQQYITNGIDNNTTTGVLTFEYSIPFKEFAHTILSVSKDRFFGSNMMLSVEWAPNNHLGYLCADVTSSFAQAANFSSVATISDIKVILAVETNPEIVNFLVNQVRTTGMTARIPYVTRFQFTNALGSNINNQIHLNRANGMRLLNLYSCLFHKETTGGLAHNLNNYAGTTNIKESSFQSQVNSNQLQEYRVNCNGDDYELLRGKISGCIIANQNVYQANRVWIESWRSGRTCDWREQDTNLDGLDLSEEILYQIDKTVVSGIYRHVIYAVVLRELNIGNNGLITIA